MDLAIERLKMEEPRNHPSYYDAMKEKALRDADKAEKLRLSSQYGLTLDTNRSVVISAPDGETYDLIVMCRYITHMHGMLERLEPVINDLTDFAEFMREFKEFASDDLATLNDFLRGTDDSEEESTSSEEDDEDQQRHGVSEEDSNAASEV